MRTGTLHSSQRSRSRRSLQPDIRAQVRTASKTRAHVEMLASPQLGGRLTGSAGERLASDYIVSELKKMGARPLPGQADFLIPFDFTAGTRDGGTTVAVDSVPPRMSNKTFSSRSDVQALSFSDNADVTAPVVFAGYGIVVPDSQDFGYDSYATLDVKDKIVLVLRYFPEDADQKTRAILSRYADLRYKALAARQHGAKAMLVVTGPQLAECRRGRPDVVRYGPCRIRDCGRQHQRNRRQQLLRRRSGQVV